MSADQRTVAVIGLGLIGGSVARDLAARGRRVIAWDHCEETLDVACAAGVVHEALGASLAGLEDAEVVVVATPVSVIADVLAAVAPRARDAQLVMDVGSTKRSAMAAAEAVGLGARFVGAHPVAGDHRSGWLAARERLFEGATVYLCAADTTQDSTLALARDLWTALGGAPEVIDAAEHDRRMAFASHLPQLVSSALGATLAGAGADVDHLGPGGRDVLRLAGSSPELWTAIALDNRDELRSALDEMQSALATIQRALAAEDGDALRNFLAQGRAWAAGEAPRRLARV